MGEMTADSRCMLMTPRRRLEGEVQRSLSAVLGEEFAGADPVVRPAHDGRFDYQSNSCLSLARRVGRPPSELAKAVALELERAAGVAVVEVSGRGFLNVRLADDALAALAADALADPRLGIARVAEPEVVVIDYSAPNVAKEMHVGHLRSTVIGDALSRILEFQGYTVVRQNHLGDWGTQFGMLVEQMLETEETSPKNFRNLTELYREAQARDRKDPGFSERARRRVVALQSGDAETRELWQRLVALSLQHINEVYGLLGVTLTDEHVKGESFYNEQLATTVDELLAKGVADESEGAVVFFSAVRHNRAGQPATLVLRKGDGAYGYDVTDLAALRHRVEELGADQLIYVVDARQTQHFDLVFEAAAAAGWLPARVRAEHVVFGTVLGPDGRPFKTRSGETVALGELLGEAIARARALVDDKSPEMDEADRAAIAEAVGIGAVKYADLSNSRQRDYVFSIDRMVSFDGNTGPYLQYALVRARSVVSKATAAGATSGAIALSDPAERALVLRALEFGDCLSEASAGLEPHKLCTLLFALAEAYSTFYDRCPVLRAPTPALRDSRVALCRLTARTLSQGLSLLGIEPVEMM